MTDSPPTPSRSHEGKWKALALVLLPIVGILLVIVAIYLVRPREPGVVTVVYTNGQAEAAAINIGAVADATDPSADITPRLGYRYRVFIEDESEDRTSGIARIGNRITFIPNARRGQTVLADITRIRPRVIDAVLVRVLSEIEMPSPPAAPREEPAAFVPPPSDPTAHVVVGAELDVTVTEASSHHPDTEGIARVRGLIVVVRGSPVIGERYRVRIGERRERVAFAEIVGGTSSPAVAPAPPPATSGGADQVVPGAILNLQIVEKSRQNPETEGVARVDGLVVFVRGATTIGETVRVRITGRSARAAFAERAP